jgi:serine/threonine protein phosphatase 1
MHIHYAIGDIHGRDDLLEMLLARIAVDHKWRHPEKVAVIVYVGDYIDRGGKSREVVDRVMRGVPGFDSVCLKGNHEDMMLACLTTDDRDVWEAWLENGGEETLASFGLNDDRRGYDHLALARALGSERLVWLERLKLTYRAGDYLFVHAGIDPDRTLDGQSEEDLLWIRGRFLESNADHGVVVVHGHTPTDIPDWRQNRIGIDTGSTWAGKLTAVVLGEAEGPRFLTVSGEPGKGP